MQIAGYLKTSLIEWPGKICSVIFTPGCNFRCPFCHNRELVEVQRYKGARVQRYKEEDVLKDLESRKKWVDAVVITGGEPTLQEDLTEFLGRLGRLGMLRMIHTNGTRPDALASILNFKFQILNFIAMDLKGDFEDYQKFTNVQFPMTKIRESIGIIIKSGVEYEFRTTIVPGLHNLENLKRLASQIKVIANLSSRGRRLKPANTRWFLQQFRPMNTLDKKFLKVKPFSKEEMEGFQKKLQGIIPQTYLRGI